MSTQKVLDAQGVTIFWIPAILCGWAAGLALNPLPVEPEMPAAASVPEWATNTDPVRQPKLRPDYAVGVFHYRCQDCHRVISSSLGPSETRTQHTEIYLEHGLNTRCRNCHHPENRDVFVDDFGGEIPWNQPQLLCAKCHGPVYRDWQHGSHGRTNGYWDVTRGQQERRKCIECHDPHFPPFPSLPPAPPPNTLRMNPHDESENGESHNPLRLSGRSAPAEARAKGH